MSQALKMRGRLGICSDSSWFLVSQWALLTRGTAQEPPTSSVRMSLTLLLLWRLVSPSTKLLQSETPWGHSSGWQLQSHGRPWKGKRKNVDLLSVHSSAQQHPRGTVAREQLYFRGLRAGWLVLQDAQGLVADCLALLGAGH